MSSGERLRGRVRARVLYSHYFLDLIAVSLCLGVFVLKRFAFLSDFLRVCSEICAIQPPNAPLPCYYGERVGVRGTAFALSAASSLTPAATARH